MTESQGMSRRNVLRAGGALATVAGVGTFLAGCTPEKAPTVAGAGAVAGTLQKGKKVIFVVHDKNAFFAPVQRGFEAFGKSVGWTTQFTGPTAGSVQDVVTAQANALNAKPDGVIFTREDPTAFDANIKLAQSQGIPIVLSNVASAGYQALNVGFVGQDFIAAGRICGLQIAEYAVKHSGQKSGVIIGGNFAPGNSALDDRITGTKLGIDEYNKANGTSFTLETLVTSTDEAKAVAAIDARWTKSPVVGWAMSAFDHQFVSTWAKSKKLVGKFGVGGFDLIAPVLDGISDGSIDFSLGQNPYAQGWLAASMIASAIAPGVPACIVDTGAEVVNKSNIVQIKKREAAFA